MYYVVREEYSYCELSSVWVQGAGAGPPPWVSVGYDCMLSYSAAKVQPVTTTWVGLFLAIALASVLSKVQLVTVRV